MQRSAASRFAMLATVFSALLLGAVFVSVLGTGFGLPANAQSSPSCRNADIHDAVAMLEGDTMRVTAISPAGDRGVTEWPIYGIEIRDAAGKTLSSERMALRPGATLIHSFTLGKEAASEPIYVRPGDEGYPEPIYGRTVRAVVTVDVGKCENPVSGTWVLSPQTGATRVSQQDVYWPIYG